MILLARSGGTRIPLPSLGIAKGGKYIFGFRHFHDGGDFSRVGSNSIFGNDACEILKEFLAKFIYVRLDLIQVWQLLGGEKLPEHYPNAVLAKTMISSMNIRALASKTTLISGSRYAFCVTRFTFRKSTQTLYSPS